MNIYDSIKLSNELEIEQRDGFLRLTRFLTGGAEDYIYFLPEVADKLEKVLRDVRILEGRKLDD